MGTPIGLEARRYMERGQLVPDEITIGMLLTRLEAPDSVDGAILMASRGTEPRRRPSMPPSPPAPVGSILPSRSRSRSRCWSRRLSGRWICQDAGHVYHEHSNPPRVAGQCDLDGSALIQRADDRPETIRARLAGQLDSLGHVVDYYRETGLLRTIDGLAPIDDVTASLASHLAASPRAGALTDGHPQVALRDRAHAPSRQDRRRGTGPDRSGARARGLDGHLDALAEAHIRQAGAIPSFLGYPGANPRRPFPASVCISLDQEIVHGIPGERTIREGQIVSVDAGAILDGWHGDAARTFYVGEPPPAVRDLIAATEAAMLAGIAAAIPGNHIEDISAAVEDVALPFGFGIIRQFVGHGIGTAMHEEPQVPNYRTGRPGRKLEPGLCLAIEPMFTLGRHEAFLAPDDWTVVTRDGSLAAHFEHTIAVTESGPQILTVL